MLIKPRFSLRFTLLTLLSICTIFALPWYVAYWLSQHRNAMHHTINHGTLIQPPISHLNGIPGMIRGKWTLILLTDKAIDTQHGAPLQPNAEQKSLYFLAQIQRGCGKDTSRVNPPVQTQAKELKRIAPPGSVFIADPHRNIIMVYKPPVRFMHVFDDLRHLLKASQIG